MAKTKKGGANKGKSEANKAAADTGAQVIASLVKMLEEHHKELQDALQERHEKLIQGLLELETESASPFETIARIAGDVAAFKTKANNTKNATPPKTAEVTKAKLKEKRSASTIPKTAKVAKAKPKEKRATGNRPTSKSAGRPKSRRRGASGRFVSKA